MDKWVIQYKILDELFTVAENKLRNFLRKTVANNAVLQELNPFGFYVSIYAGKEYYSKKHSDDVMPNWKYIDIDKSLVEKFDMLHHMHEDLKREKITIAAYITTILNNSQSSADLNLLLPEDVVKAYDDVPKLLPGMMAAEYYKAIVTNGKKKEQEDLIKQRILTNLLIRDIYL